MTTPISFDIHTGQTIANNSPSESRRKHGSLELQQITDKLDISSLKIENGDLAEENKVDHSNSWYSRFGLEAGIRTLKNGNRQEIIIEGNHMELTEYKDGRLVRKETGDISGNKVYREASFFGEDGNVSQTSKATLTTHKAGTENEFAVMQRDVEWYDGGNLSRTLHDSMTVQASSKKLVSLLSGSTSPDSTESLILTLTKDTLHTDYQADIVSYNDGHVSQTALIKQGSDSQLHTNRSPAKFSGMEPWTTQEVKKKSDLLIQISDFDDNGDMLRQAEFSDTHEMYGEQTQESRVSWFKDGELVKRTHGTFKTKASRDSHLKARPSAMDILSISEEEFSGSTPLSSTDLLDRLMQRGLDDPGLYGDVAKKDMGEGDYSSVRDVTSTDFKGREQDMSMTSEEFRNGEIVARQVDEHHVKDSHRPVDEKFAVGRGLSENMNPSRLVSTTHLDESYDNGIIRKTATLKMSEFLATDKDGIHSLETHYSAESGNGTDKQNVSGVLQGPLEQADREHLVAGKLLQSEIQQTFNSMILALRGLESEYES